MFPKLNFSAEASDGEIPAEPSDESEDELNLTDVEKVTSTIELIRKAIEAGNIRNNPKTGSGADNPDTNKQAESNKKRKGAETVDDSAKSPEGPKKKKSKNSDNFSGEIRPDWLKEDITINSFNCGQYYCPNTNDTGHKQAEHT